MRTTIIKCDVCNRAIEDDEQPDSRFIFDKSSVISHASGTCIYLDLCGNCLKKVLDLFGKSADHFSPKGR